MDLKRELDLHMTRRQLFGMASTGIGVGALASLLTSDAGAMIPGLQADRDPKTGGLVGLPHFPPKAKRVIFLHQSGGPAQMDLFDYKPGLRKYQGNELPDSIRMGQRITGMTSGQGKLPVASSIFTFGRKGQSGAWVRTASTHRKDRR